MDLMFCGPLVAAGASICALCVQYWRWILCGIEDGDVHESGNGRWHLANSQPSASTITPPLENHARSRRQPRKREPMNSCTAASWTNGWSRHIPRKWTVFFDPAFVLYFQKQTHCRIICGKERHNKTSTKQQNSQGQVLRVNI